jgi:hypothetical protein
MTHLPHQYNRVLRIAHSIHGSPTINNIVAKPPNFSQFEEVKLEYQKALQLLPLVKKSQDQKPQQAHMHGHCCRQCRTSQTDASQPMNEGPHQ